MKLLKIAAAAALLAVVSVPSFAGSVALNMSGLPSTQGWTYVGTQSMPEAGAFTLSSGILRQDTTATDTDPGAWYSRTDIITAGSANVRVRMRLISNEFQTPFGAGVEYSVSQYYFLFGLGKPDASSPAQVYVKTGPNASEYTAIAGVNAADWHDYEMAIDLTARTFTLFIDGANRGTYSAVYNAGVTAAIAFGDLTEGGNAIADYSALSFSSTSPGTPAAVPALPAWSLALLGILLASSALLLTRQSSRNAGRPGGRT